MTWENPGFLESFIMVITLLMLKGELMHMHKLLDGVLAVILCMLLLAIPVLCQQQDAAAQARADAERNVSGGTWLIIGIFLGIIGYVIALASPPRAPAAALIGKTPEYAAVYSDTYTEAGKKIQMKKAMTGCLIGTGIQVAATVLLVVLANNSTGYYY